MAEVNMKIQTSVDAVELRVWIDTMDKAGQDTIEDLAKIAYNAAVAAAPVGAYASSHVHHDGERPFLEDGIKTEIGAHEFTLYIDDVNLLSLDQGSRPHEIHGNPNLRFFWENEGKPFKGPMVNHPGTGAYDFMYAGLEAADAEAEDVLDAHYL